MPQECINFRHINNYTWDYEEKQVLMKEIERCSEYLGRTTTRISYFRHVRKDGICDFYCRMSHTQMQWLGEDFTVQGNLIKAPA
jgi:hypothetical protein